MNCCVEFNSPGDCSHINDIYRTNVFACTYTKAFFYFTISVILLMTEFMTITILKEKFVMLVICNILSKCSQKVELRLFKSFCFCIYDNYLRSCRVLGVRIIGLCIISKYTVSFVLNISLVIVNTRTARKFCWS